MLARVEHNGGFLVSDGDVDDCSSSALRVIVPATGQTCYADDGITHLDRADMVPLPDLLSDPVADGQVRDPDAPHLLTDSLNCARRRPTEVGAYQDRTAGTNLITLRQLAQLSSPDRQVSGMAKFHGTRTRLGRTRMRHPVDVPEGHHTASRAHAWQRAVAVGQAGCARDTVRSGCARSTGCRTSPEWVQDQRSGRSSFVRQDAHRQRGTATITDQRSCRSVPVSGE